MPAVDAHKQILIVDRDVASVEPLRHRLNEAGFIVSVITDGAAAVMSLLERPPHLVILEWSMPGFISREVVERVRITPASHPVRLIILSSLSGEHDVVEGLNLGADDYIAKPFSLSEAVARVGAVLRCRPGFQSATPADRPELVLDAARHRVLAHGELLRLRSVEFRLLEFLMAHPGRTFNRVQLLAQVWGGEHDVDERTVDVNVQRLRKILRRPGVVAHIQTVRGFGYRFEARSTSHI